MMTKVRAKTGERITVAGVRGSQRAAGLAVLLCLAVAGTACTSTGAASRAGGSSDTVVLRLGTDDRESAPTGPIIRRFAERVAALSDGEVEIEPVWEVNADAGPEARDWDQRVARQVVAGDLDLGLVPARAWDTEGVDSLRVFSAPMLLDSYGLVAKVVTSNLGDDALAGLEGVGVTGLALVPEGLRHVFAFSDAMTSPKDFVGTTVRTPRSDTGYALFEAWGAVPADLTASSFDTGVQDGTVGAAESSFVRAADLPTPTTTTAGNIITTANLHVLAVQTEALERLSSKHADVLRKAATEVRDQVLLTAPPDETGLAEAYCAAGGTVVTASAGDIAALRQAAQPVYDELEQDPTTRTAIDRVEGLKSDLPVQAPLEPCKPTGGPAPASDATPLPADTVGVFPEGVYRRSIPAELLLAKGTSQVDASNHAGIWTLTFKDGTVTMDDVLTSTGRRSTDSGPYCVAGGRVTVAPGQRGQCKASFLFSAEWSLDGRQLVFAKVLEGQSGRPTTFFDALWASAPWVRVD